MKIITRTCNVCRTKNDKKNLVRFVRNKNGEISFDKNQKMDGRGCYVCSECLDKMKKSRVLNRAYKINVSESEYDRLINIAKADI